jgi:hypothetical protein
MNHARYYFAVKRDKIILDEAFNAIRQHISYCKSYHAIPWNIKVGYSSSEIEHPVETHRAH